MRSKSLLVLTTTMLGSAALTPVTAFAAAPPTCSQLAALLATNAYISQTASEIKACLRRRLSSYLRLRQLPPIAKFTFNSRLSLDLRTATRPVNRRRSALV